MVRHEFSGAVISGVIGIERIEEVLEFPELQPFRESSGDSCSREELSADAAIGRNPHANWPRSPGCSWPLAKPLALRQLRPDPPVAASPQGIGRQQTEAESNMSSRLGDSDNERWASLPDRQDNSAYKCQAVRNYSHPRDDSGKQKVVSSPRFIG